jgi:hypothetical protein
LPDSSDLRRDIDPIQTPVRVRVDVNIAHIISMLYSGVAADHVVSPDEQPLSIGSGQGHKILCRSDFLMMTKGKWMT